MRFISEVYWDKGKRLLNQDSISLQEVSMKGTSVVFALLCDGIGGLWGGEIASGFVAERMTEWFYREALPMIKKGKNKSKLMKAGIRALYSCNEEMLTFAKEKQIRFGTTMTMLLIYKRKYIIWHSGDSRIYLIRNKMHMQRLTEDHALDRHKLTKCIGSFEWQKPDAESGRIKRQTVFLICSDGFRHIISEEQIMESLMPVYIFTKEQIYIRIKEIAEYSRKKGEEDNISALVIKAE